MQHTIQAKVTKVDIEDGFFGLVNDLGFQYQPVDPLPTEFQEDGKAVKVTIEDAEGVSFMQWGQTVKVLHIEAV